MSGMMEFLLFFFILQSGNLQKADENEDNVFYLWHITDFHIDFNYTKGGSPFCLDISKQCCRKEKEKEIFHAGMFGFPLSSLCDIPKRTFESTLRFIRDYPVDQSRVLGVLSGGDFPAHDEPTQSEEANIERFKYGHEKFDEYFKEKGFKVFGTLGNHDSFPIDQLDFQPGGGYLLNTAASMWSKWITDPEQVENIHNYGLYSVPVALGLRIISLNHFWVDVRNHEMKKYPSMKHFLANWLQNELRKSKENNEVVIITGHYCPGIEAPYANYGDDNDSMINDPYIRVTEEWNQDLVNISQTYQDTIILQVTGHEHIDRFVVIKDEQLQNPTSVVLVTPAVTTQVRLLKYDALKKKIVDVVTFYNDISVSNEVESMDENWKEEYSFSGLFGIDEVTPEKMQDVVDRMEKDEELYTHYQDYHFSNFVNNTCIGLCKQAYFCSMNYIRKEVYDKCMGK